MAGENSRMSRTQRPHLRKTSLLLAILLAGSTLPLAGCLVAGYSSGSGFWMWPGSIVLTLILILFFFLRGRH
jgi:hypothetical protein